MLHAAATKRKRTDAMTSLREVRAECLLSIRELARRASVAPSTIYLIEAGRTIPRPSVVRRLSDVLGVEPRVIDEFQRSIEASKVPTRNSGRVGHRTA
jgi:transcriptional regulator with XRE-family HTH domain